MGSCPKGGRLCSGSARHNQKEEVDRHVAALLAMTKYLVGQVEPRSRTRGRLRKLCGQDDLTYAFVFVSSRGNLP